MPSTFTPGPVIPKPVGPVESRRAAAVWIANTALVVSALLPTFGSAQDPANVEAAPRNLRSDQRLRRDLAQLVGIELRFPRDKDLTVASVDGREIPLAEVVRHIDEQHAPGFAAFLATAAGNLYFEKRLPADWVRHYADIVALRADARHLEIPADMIKRKLAKAAEDGITAWIATIEAQAKEQGTQAPMSKERKASLSARHLRENGLALERQGWLDILTPDLDGVGIDAAHHFHRDYPRYFGGVVHLAHILVYDRHPVTGQLLVDADRKEAARLRGEVEARLAPDGSNFEDVARLLSEDRRTGERGGILRNVARFDSRLPPSVTRAAWDLQDGQWMGPIESSFGQHFVKRLSYTHYAFFLVTENTVPKVREVMRRKIQEDTMIDARQRHRVKLAY